MTSENRAGQIVETLPAVLALVPTTLRLGIVSALSGDALRTAFRAGYFPRPSYFTDFLVALGIIDQILDIHHGSSIRLDESDQAVRLIYPISLGAVNTSLKPLLSPAPVRRLQPPPRLQGSAVGADPEGCRPA